MAAPSGEHEALDCTEDDDGSGRMLARLAAAKIGSGTRGGRGGTGGNGGGRFSEPAFDGLLLTAAVVEFEDEQ